MNAEVYVEWCRRQGRSVVRTKSAYWYSEGYNVYQAFPFHRLISPDKSELSELFLHKRAVALRYFAAPDIGAANSAYHMVYDREDYGFDDLTHWARKNVRRGLRSCVVERIAFDLLLKEGWALRLDTLERQGRAAERSYESWRSRYAAAADLPGFEVWGAMVDGNLAAYLVTCRVEDCVYMIHQQCHRRYLRDHVNNALAFTVTEQAIADPDVQCVFYGVQSLDAATSVDEFKMRMGYRPKAVKECILFHPWLSLVLNGATYRLMKLLSVAAPKNRTLSKGAGMVHLNLYGRPSPENPRERP